MNYKISILEEKDFITSDWSGGRTTQMYIYPENSIYRNLDFKWRISSATVDLEESDFTELKGVHRFITTLDNELKLTHDYKDFIELKPFEIYEFEGDLKTHSYGKVKDFNLMLANGATGDLVSLYVDNEISLKIESESSQRKFELFYSYNESLLISIDSKDFELKARDLLVLELDANSVIYINLKTTNPAIILHAKLQVWS